MATLTLHLLFWLPCDGMRPSEKIFCLNFKLGTSLPRSLPFPETTVSTNSPRVSPPGEVILRISSQDPALTIHSLNFSPGQKSFCTRTAFLCVLEIWLVSPHTFFLHYGLSYKLYAPGFAFDELNFSSFLMLLYLPLSIAYFEIQSEDYDLLNSAGFFGIFPSLGQKPQARDLILMVKML